MNYDTSLPRKESFMPRIYELIIMNLLSSFPLPLPFLQPSTAKALRGVKCFLSSLHFIISSPSVTKDTAAVLPTFLLLLLLLL